jgi:hypothetical protein
VLLTRPGVKTPSPEENFDVSIFQAPRCKIKVNLQHSAAAGPDRFSPRNRDYLHKRGINDATARGAGLRTVSDPMHVAFLLGERGETRQPGGRGPKGTPGDLFLFRGVPQMIARLGPCLDIPFPHFDGGVLPESERRDAPLFTLEPRLRPHSDGMSDYRQLRPDNPRKVAGKPVKFESVRGRPASRRSGWWACGAG